MAAVAGSASTRRGRAPAARSRSAPAPAPTDNPQGGSTIDSARTRVNDQIRISPVRLIAPDGSQVGVVSLDQAREQAQADRLDLVEVAPGARPPVVRIMDWGKHQYELQKQAREARKKQHTVQVKEVKFRPKTDEHDLNFKIRNARRFLDKRQSVKVTVRFRARELRRPELGQQILDRVADELQDVATIDRRDRHLDGRQLTMMLEPQD